MDKTEDWPNLASIRQHCNEEHNQQGEEPVSAEKSL